MSRIPIHFIIGFFLRFVRRKVGGEGDCIFRDFQRHRGIQWASKDHQLEPKLVGVSECFLMALHFSDTDEIFDRSIVDL